MKRTAVSIAVTGIACAFILSCASTPKAPAEDATAREIIQLAQEAIDRSDTKAAAFYYNTARVRFSADLATVCACEYELAFLDYKQKNLKAAEEGFKSLLARYAGPDAAFLPQEYRILAKKILDKIEAEREKAAFKGAKPAGSPTP